VDGDRDRIIAERILDESSEESPIIDRELYKKYLIYAKNVKTKLTIEARKVIKEFYLKARSSASSDGLPVTPRQLEALKRLAEAHAKLMLHEEVSAEDAQAAVRLLNISLSQTLKGNLDSSDLNRAPITKSEKEYFLLNVLNERGETKEEDLKKFCGWNDYEFNRIIKSLLDSGIIYQPKFGFPVTYDKIKR
jgi:replicative DNA helicase Mcm